VDNVRVVEIRQKEHRTMGRRAVSREVRFERVERKVARRRDGRSSRMSEFILSDMGVS
jgi:hypothetical protein